MYKKKKKKKPRYFSQMVQRFLLPVLLLNAKVPHFSLIMKFKLVFIRNFSKQMEYGMCGKVVNNNIERIK